MKTFITALILLSLTAIFVTGNAVYVDRAEHELSEAVDAMISLERIKAAGLPEGGSSGGQSENISSDAEALREEGRQRISEFLALWDKHKHTLELFIMYDYLYTIQSATDQLTAFYEGEFYTDYETQRNTLISAIKRLGEVEDFSPDNIF